MTGSLQIDKNRYYAVLNLRDESGKRKQKKINLQLDAIPGNKRRAEKALREALAQYERDNITVCRPSILFANYILVWLEESKPGIQQITYDAYDSYVNLHIDPYFRKLGVSLQELTYRHIQSYYTTKGKKLSANSLRKHHVVIRGALQKALKHDLIASNPADKTTLPKVEKYTGSFLSIEQGNALLEAAKDTPMEPVIIFGMVYGLRRSEIAGMKWAAIDFEHDKLTVEHTVVKLKTTIARDGTKNRTSNRTMPLNQAVKAYLLRLRSQQAEDKQNHGTAYTDTDYICRWPDGRPMTCDYLSRGFRRLLQRNGLPLVRLHDTRHSCASYMLKMGFSLKEIADWLGHSDIRTAANTYTHLDFESKRSVADRFAGLLPV